MKVSACININSWTVHPDEAGKREAKLSTTNMQAVRMENAINDHFAAWRGSTRTARCCA